MVGYKQWLKKVKGTRDRSAVQTRRILLRKRQFNPGSFRPLQGQTLKRWKQKHEVDRTSQKLKIILVVLVLYLKWRALSKTVSPWSLCAIWVLTYPLLRNSAQLEVIPLATIPHAGYTWPCCTTHGLWSIWASVSYWGFILLVSSLIEAKHKSVN